MFRTLTLLSRARVSRNSHKLVLPKVGHLQRLPRKDGRDTMLDETTVALVNKLVQNASNIAEHQSRVTGRTFSIHADASVGPELKISSEGVEIEPLSVDGRLGIALELEDGSNAKLFFDTDGNLYVEKDNIKVFEVFLDDDGEFAASCYAQLQASVELTQETVETIDVVRNGSRTTVDVGDHEEVKVQWSLDAAVGVQAKCDGFEVREEFSENLVNGQGSFSPSATPKHGHVTITKESHVFTPSTTTKTVTRVEGASEANVCNFEKVAEEKLNVASDIVVPPGSVGAIRAFANGDSEGAKKSILAGCASGGVKLAAVKALTSTVVSTSIGTAAAPGIAGVFGATVPTMVTTTTTVCPPAGAILLLGAAVGYGVKKFIL